MEEKRPLIATIERSNPGWADLFPFLCEGAPDPRVKPEDDGEGSVAYFLKRLADGQIPD